MTEESSNPLQNAITLHRSGKLDQAEHAYREILAANPSAADALHLLGLVMQARGDAAEAERLIAQAIELNPRAHSYRFNHALALEALGRRSEAEAAYRFAHALKPHETAALNNLAMVQARSGNVTGAEKTLREALTIRPGAPELVLNLCELLLETAQLGRAGEAEGLLRQLLSAMPQLRAAQALLARAIARSDPDQSEKLIRSVVKRDPDNPRHRKLLAQLLFQWGRHADAAKAVQDLLDKAPFEVDGLTLLAATKLHLGDAAAAASLCQRADKLDPDGLSRMAARRLAVWTAASLQTGARDEAKHLLALDRTILYDALPTPLGFGKGDAFNARLAEEVLGHPTFAWNPPGYVTRGGGLTGDLAQNPTPAIAALIRSLGDRVEAYIQWLALDPDHPFLRTKPAAFRLALWANVLPSGTQLDTHIHEDAWASGVYYVQIPAFQGTEHAGWLEFGRPPAALRPPADAPSHLIEPVAGHVAVFPASTYHGTRPFTSEQPRISIAFNAYLA